MTDDYHISPPGLVKTALSGGLIALLTLLVPIGSVMLDYKENINNSNINKVDINKRPLAATPRELR